MWDKQGSFSHVFFMSITEVFTINAEAGGVVGSVLCYGKTITCQDLSYKQF